MKIRNVIQGFAPLLLIGFLAGCQPREEAAKRATAFGTVEVDEVRVASRYGGRVERIHVQEGDTLKTGQLIAELDAAELHARRSQTAALLSELEAGPRREEIATTKAEWEAQLADLNFARTELKRAEVLFTQGVNTEAERDRATMRVNVLEKSVAAAKSRHDLLLAGTRPERLAQTRAQLAEIDTQLREMKILAPTNCVLEILSVKAGDVLVPGREAATLLLSDHLWVRVFAPQTWLGHLQLSQPVKARADSLPDKEFNGVIEQIARSAEFTPRNVQTKEERIKQVFAVKIRLNNEGDKLRAGMTVEVDFPSVPR